MRGFPVIVGLVLLMGALVQPVPVMAGTAFPPGGDDPGGDPTAPIKIATGTDSSADGYLELSPDEYGSYGAFGVVNGITEDLFRPAGLSLQQTTFTSGLYLFNPAAGQQELLSDIQEWQDILLAGGGLDRSVTSANVASDTNGDTVNDTLVSSFRIFGGATDLSFDLTQLASSLGGGVAQLRQDYTITNDGAGPISFVLVRNYDGDLLWDSDFSNDEVGTTMHGAGLGSYVYMQEANIPGDTGVTLSCTSATKYYGGKNGVEPPLGFPAFGFGTDVQIWENGGIPTSWVNYIAGVDYDVNGDSGEFPPGVGDPADGFTGMEWEVSLDPGESTTLTLNTTYGQSTPGGCQLEASIKEKLVTAGDRVRVRINLHHVRQQTVSVPFVIWLEDRQGNVLVRDTTPAFTIEFGDHLRFMWQLQLPPDIAPGRYRVMAGVTKMLQGTAWASEPVEIDVSP